MFPGWNLGTWDGYAFSGFEATFGNLAENGLESVWSYNNWDPYFCDGCDYGGYSDWFPMRRIR